MHEGTFNGGDEMILEIPDISFSVGFEAGESYRADPVGSSAYEIAVDNGFEGSEEEWLESLKAKPPVKGVDYFTKGERAEMIAELKASLKSEVWTFTLVDGSEIKRTVMLK